VRFHVLPFGGLELLNVLAVIVTAIALLVLVLDPLMPPWQARLSPAVIDFFKAVTDIGKSHWILISTGVFVIVMVVLDAESLQRRHRVRRAVRTAAALYVFAAVAITGIVVNLVKNVIGRARPRFFDDYGPFSFDFLAGKASWASFPSGHSTTAMALGMALALIFPRLRWVFLCLGFWIAVSRVFVRAHYPSDVLAGALLGATGAWLLARAFAQRRIVFGFDGEGGLVRRRGLSGRLR
jgi:undecaprenyl-diphosphatase